MISFEGKSESKGKGKKERRKGPQRAGRSRGPCPPMPSHLSSVVLTPEPEMKMPGGFGSREEGKKGLRKER